MDQGSQMGQGQMDQSGQSGGQMGQSGQMDQSGQSGGQAGQSGQSWSGQQSTGTFQGTGGPAAGTRNYPPCSRTVTDSCIQRERSR